VIPLGTETVTVLSGMTRDNFGDPQNSDTGTEVTGCSVQPASSTESTAHGELVVVNAVLYAPCGTSIGALDRVQWRGQTYQVNGQPLIWQDDIGPGDSYVKASLLLREGNA
jgi:hypothetical protein